MEVLRKSMSLRGVVLILLSLLFAVALSACAEKKSQRSGEEYTVPSEHIFAVTYDAAWKGTVQALSEAERIQSLDKESGRIVTEVKEINNLVQNLLPIAMFGKVYKNGYSLHLREVASGETRISIRSNLMLTQLAIFEGELHDALIESYMCQELFRRICINLSPDARKCTTLFPDFHMVSVSCQAPAPTPDSGRVQTPPQVSISVKEVQRILVKAGYTPGPIDGLMGKKTRAALTRFQEDKGIEGTGTIDWATLQALGL